MRQVLVGAGVSSLLGLTALSVVAAGVATAASAKAHVGHSIYGCVRTSDGTLRIVSAGRHCQPGEKRVAWNKRGPQGVSGHSILHGPKPPTAGIGSVGDFVLNTQTHVLFGPKSASGWASGTTLVGPAGPSGDRILSGAGAPPASAGETGDFCVDTAARLLFGPKPVAAGRPPAQHSSGHPEEPGRKATPDRPATRSCTDLTHPPLARVPMEISTSTPRPTRSMGRKPVVRGRRRERRSWGRPGRPDRRRL